MQLNIWQPYIISAAIGLLVGIEREKSSGHPKAMGIRTFLLMALLGAISGNIELVWFTLLVAFFAFSLIVVSYYNTTRDDSLADVGMTTEFAAGIVFCLGFVSHRHPVLTAVLGPFVALILVLKTPLHRLTGRIKVSELQTALLLLLIGVSVVNLVEDRVIDPWGVFNPQKFGLLVLALAVIEFASYILTKMLGSERGALVFGFLGGIVSSTAVLVSAVRRNSKQSPRWRQDMLAVLAAKMAALGEVLLIVGIISQDLLWRVAGPVSAAIGGGAVSLSLLARRAGRTGGTAGELRSPLDWRGVIRLALLLAAILAVITFVKNSFGEAATMPLSFLGGLFELHGVTLANSTLFAREQLHPGAAVLNILVAVTASLAAKISIAWFVARGALARVITICFSVMAALLWLTYMLQGSVLQ